MLINEIFESIQGEGRFAGCPATFIRLSGCNKQCDFCDSKYHVNGKKYSIEDIVEIINDSRNNIIVWTGGEPLLQSKEMFQVIEQTKQKKHHIESNGSLINNIMLYRMDSLFDYICFSPKSKADAVLLDMSCIKTLNTIVDVKVVTDGELNKELILFATMLMPLSIYDDKKDLEIMQRVWNICCEKRLWFSPRLQRIVFGKKRGV